MSSRLVVARGLVVVSGMVGLGMATGCHSSYVEATVKNATGTTVELVEVDYPSASFGHQGLPDGAEYKYRFKVLGTGATKVLWTDAAHHDHTVSGPSLREGDEGRMVVTLGPNTAEWKLELKGR